MTYSINWPIRHSVPFQKLYLPIDQAFTGCLWRKIH